MTHHFPAPPLRLSVFALDLDTGQPLAELVCYAELTVAASVLALPTTPLGPPLHAALIDAEESLDTSMAAQPNGAEQWGTALESALSRVLTTESRARLTDQKSPAAVLRELLGNALRQTGRESLSGLSMRETTRVLQAAVRAYAQEHEIAVMPEDELTDTLWAYPLGTLATDHVGYLSFDLTRLPDDVRDILADAIDARIAERDAELPASLTLYPSVTAAAPVDVMRQARFAQDAIVSRVEAPASKLISRGQILGMPALQAPSLTDWRLSGGSFAANPSRLIGDDDCEELLPAGLALHEYNLYQVVRLTDVNVVPQAMQDRIRVGVVHEFRLSWVPIGHSLGQILYSAPLAPGESVDLAVVDWSRQDEATASRTPSSTSA